MKSFCILHFCLFLLHAESAQHEKNFPRKYDLDTEISLEDAPLTDILAL